MIEAIELRKTIEGNQILKGLSFKLKAGRIYGIIGPNGVGKSTLLQLLAGIEFPTSGQILLEGIPAGRYARKSLAKWLAVLQQGGLAAAGFTVREVVAMGRYPFQNWLGGEKTDTGPLIDEAMEAMGLRGLEDRPVDQLSGGERQRVALAKVMVQEPRLLLLDEPTTYLDIGYQLQLLDTVSSWQQERGITVVAVLHDINLAAQYCQELLVLSGGRLEAFGTPAEVISEELIRRVYGAGSVVLPHPQTGIPQLLLLPGKPSSDTR
ncbi:ABC transporter ATP-binding protein [Paenibacillus nasutitermitis]|uniref:ABC transporter ATP-binding protein n=1 Tax=Paenibacillus nasutitermitis TaxID=1652958 RepID=A0A917DTJ7_9BACL|nr:ABC transporter ATP-binding protein [Paenibacillus nasutitermitis]GGD67575.1 ABC transporter ATP-binding protein [Paenibacillus nasutitermitis]